MRFDVAVIGGGLSGLCAADALAERGRSVLVLEKGAVWGGKVATTTTPMGRAVEHGPTYIGPTQRHMQMLVRKLGLTTTGTFFAEGYSSVNHFSTPIGPMKMLFDGTTHTDVPGIEEQITKIDKLSAEVAANLTEPWNTSVAALDGVHVKEWADANIRGPVGEVMKSLLFTFVRSILSVGPDELSMLFLLYYCARCGGFRYMTTAIDFGPDSRRIREGNGMIPKRLVEMLKVRQVEMVTGADVEHIAQSVSGVELRCADSSTFSAKFGVVALPAPHTLSMTYDPPLPKERFELCTRMKMGRTYKGFVFYRNPWWRTVAHKPPPVGWKVIDDAFVDPRSVDLVHRPLPASDGSKKPGYSGYTNGDYGPFIWTMDATWNDDTGPRHPGIMWFATAKFAASLLGKTPAERAARVHERLIWLFEGATPEDPIEFDDHAYVDKAPNGDVIGFGPTGVLRPGELTLFGEALRKPHARVFWAGTESAIFWGGYMEGAIDAGLRAAQNVDRMLGDRPIPVVDPFWPEL